MKSEPPPELARYQKQILFAPIGIDGQRSLLASRVAIFGCGALGCVVADALCRAGVGHVRIVDRDFVETSNLQRQILFTEDDVTANLPKAIAAADRLRRVNSEITIDPIVADIDSGNIIDLVNGVDLILDGTDNFETRFLINDVSLETGIPWIYTGCVGSHGQTMPVIPGVSACLRCLIPEAPPPGTTETCDTAGVLGPAISVIASLQVAAALRILIGDVQNLPRQLSVIDVWDLSLRNLDVSKLRDNADCPACRHGRRDWLHGEKASASTILCGRNAVQVSPPDRTAVTIESLTERLSTAGTVTANRFLVRCRIAGSELEITAFPDGRAIIRGTEDISTARSIYARYVGS